MKQQGGFCVRNRFSFRFLVLSCSALFVIAATMVTLLATQQPAQGNASAAQGGGEGRGRGRGAPNPLLSQPAPRLPDGTVNLGRVEGEKGIWNLPYIQNMGDRSRVIG